MAGSFADYLEDKVLDHVTGKLAYTSPTVYVGLSSTTPTDAMGNVTEPTGGSYARVATSAATWNSAAGGSIDNALEVAFAQATADWVSGSNLTYAVFYDALTVGNPLGYGSLTNPRAVLNGDIAKFAPGSIVWTLD